MRTIRLALGFVLVAGCKDAEDIPGNGVLGDSGVLAQKSYVDLDDGEVDRLCAWSVAMGGGEGHITDCGGGRSRQGKTKAECVEAHGKIRKLTLPCAVTVADVEGCSVEEKNDPCGKHPTCDRLNACIDTASGKD